MRRTHEIIAALVVSKDKNEALAKAKNIFEKVVEDGEFDYFVTFDEDGLGVAGRDRWGDIKPIYRFEDKEAKKLIEEIVADMESDRLTAMEEIEKLLSKRGKKEILRNSELYGAITYQAGVLSGHYGRTRIFCDDWSAPTTKEELNEYLKSIESYYKKGYDLWVVFADVHF